MTWIDQQFGDAIGRHEVTSDPDGEYNCIAYAADDKTEWWSHHPGYKWPAPRSPLVSSLIAVFSGLGYEDCKDNSAYESGYEKVAIYARNGIWTHASKQIPSGKWKSKLGPDEDIEHDTADCLCGASYGVVHCYMRRTIQWTKNPEKAAMKSRFPSTQ